MKKVLTAVLCFIFVIEAFCPNQKAEAASYSKEIAHGFGQVSKRETYEYYLYDEDTRYYYTFDYKKLTQPIHWGDYEKSLHIEPFTITVSMGTSWSSTTSQEFSVDKNFSKVALGVGYKNVSSHTVTKDESKSYSTTLTYDSPDGYYYYAAIMDFDEYSYNLFTTKTSLFGKKTYCEDYGTIKVFLHSECWIQFVRQDQI